MSMTDAIANQICECGHPQYEHGYKVRGVVRPFCSIQICDCEEFRAAEISEDTATEREP